MASIWFWLLVCIVSIVVGIILVAVPFLVNHFARSLFAKVKPPKDKSKLKQYMLDNKELLSYQPVKPPTREELIQQEKEAYKRFRQFEKLRQLAIKDNEKKGTDNEENKIED